MKNKLIAVIMIVTLCFGAFNSNAFARSKVKLNKKKVTICVNKVVKLKVKNTKKKVKWKSLNSKVASVNKKGKVKGRKVGKTTIFAKVGKKKLKCKVIVKKAKTAKKNITPSNKELVDKVVIHDSAIITEFEKEYCVITFSLLAKDGVTHLEQAGTANVEIINDEGMSVLKGSSKFSKSPYASEKSYGGSYYRVEFSTLQSIQHGRVSTGKIHLQITLDDGTKINEVVGNIANLPLLTPNELVIIKTPFVPGELRYFENYTNLKKRLNIQSADTEVSKSDSGEFIIRVRFYGTKQYQTSEYPEDSSTDFRVRLYKGGDIVGEQVVSTGSVKMYNLFITKPIYFNVQEEGEYTMYLDPA